MKDQYGVIVKHTLKIILIIFIIVVFIIMSYKTIVNNSNHIHNVEQSALMEAIKEYGEGCFVASTRLSDKGKLYNNKQYSVAIINKDRTIMIGYKVSYRKYENGEEKYYVYKVMEKPGNWGRQTVE